MATKLKIDYNPKPTYNGEKVDLVLISKSSNRSAKYRLSILTESSNYIDKLTSFRTKKLLLGLSTLMKMNKSWNYITVMIDFKLGYVDIKYYKRDPDLLAKDKDIVLTKQFNIHQFFTENKPLQKSLYKRYFDVETDE